jgi:hypothetical protein
MLTQSVLSLPQEITATAAKAPQMSSSPGHSFAAPPKALRIAPYLFDFIL